MMTFLGCGSVSVRECPYCKGRCTEAFRVDMSQCLLLILKVFSKNVSCTIEPEIWHLMAWSQLRMLGAGAGSQ